MSSCSYLWVRSPHPLYSTNITSVFITHKFVSKWGKKSLFKNVFIRNEETRFRPPPPPHTIQFPSRLEELRFASDFMINYWLTCFSLSINVILNKQVTYRWPIYLFFFNRSIMNKRKSINKFAINKKNS